MDTVIPLVFSIKIPSPQNWDPHPIIASYRTGKTPQWDLVYRELPNCWISQQQENRTVPNLVAACPEDVLMEFVCHGIGLEQCKIVTLFKGVIVVSNCHREMSCLEMSFTMHRI